MMVLYCCKEQKRKISVSRAHLSQLFDKAVSISYEKKPKRPKKKLNILRKQHIHKSRIFSIPAVLPASEGWPVHGYILSKSHIHCHPLLQPKHSYHTPPHSSIAFLVFPSLATLPLLSLKLYPRMYPPSSQYMPKPPQTRCP